MLVDPIAMLQGDRINSSSRRCSKARSADLTPQSGNAAPSHPLTTNHCLLTTAYFLLSTNHYLNSGAIVKIMLMPCHPWNANCMRNRYISGLRTRTPNPHELYKFFFDQ